MKNKSRTILSALAFASLAIPAQAETMTSEQRDKLAKSLDSLINKSKSTLDSRQGTAYKAYKSALGSSSAAYDLYLNCVEKVDFLEAGKKSSDFRGWKKAKKEMLSDPGFRLALRHQLNWLVLTIEAARNEEDDYSALSDKARDVIGSIFNSAQEIEGHQGVLKKSVLNSVFAKAYGFGSYKVKDWPTTPLNFAQVYDKVVYPSLRDQKKASSLHSAWKERISYQEQSLLYWAPIPKSKSVGMKKDIKPPAYNKFIENEKPKLVWQMEMDVYKAGDEYGAASRMLTHLSGNISHNSATEWAKGLNQLIGPPSELDLTPDTTDDDEFGPLKEKKSNYIELPAH